MTNANLSLEARFHAGQIDTDTAIALLAHSPAVQAALRQFWPEDVTPKMATGALREMLHYGRMLQALIHGLNRAAGWWSDLETGEPKERNDGELCMLIVTEISEGFEGVRKNLTDDKLGHRKMFEVELGDAMIRELDVGGGRGFDLFAALFEKLAYNQCRSDHKREARLAPNGKKI
ncbi:hypothetical protein SAMN05216577_1165 [Pseudomonas citronellolis]|uniref:Uncharacterized protein n=1 Tax=Pseudomonas citronellolis TaxID=53408 RepID=A0AAQ1HNY1_9PSED|nr:hypothetical protein [Pseudomonas citronellolis]SFD07206.1 hypothetical protein SAMN05216577_1165 [Pseudomonas citronellolis]